MRPKRTALMGLALTALVGCTLTQLQPKKADGLPGQPRLGGAGRLIAPKRCVLKLMVLTRPSGDKIVRDEVWRGADLQVLDDEARRAAEANGLRVGRITGELPEEVRAVLDAPPPNKVDPILIVVPSGEHSRVELRSQVEQANLFLDRGGKAVGKTYDDARASIRLAPSHGEGDGVSVRVTPEVRHGPVRQGWKPAPGGAFAPQQFVMSNGQDEETFRDLAATLELRPGQVGVDGRPGRPARQPRPLPVHRAGAEQRPAARKGAADLGLTRRFG